jgi:hypothetical protein
MLRPVAYVRRLLVTANVVPNSPILVNLIMDMIYFSETSVLKTATHRNIPEEGIHQTTVISAASAVLEFFGISQFRFPMTSLDISIDVTLPTTQWLLGGLSP